MCGITGWIDWEVDLTRQRPVLEAMTDKLSRRGPDAAGFWLSPRAALGHRRLIVVDPEGGGQPMTRHRGNKVYTITYNGELYNTLDLRRELEARGHKFLTRNSDTEVLLYSYLEWGPECLQRLNGIFAFGIWSEEDQTLFMARDRLGVKPLFYARRGSALLFGSELKALLAHPGVQPEVDAGGLAEIFVMGPSRTPGHGVFRGISEVRPGHWALYNRSGLRLGQYWSLVSRPHGDDLATTALKVRGLLKDAVTRQLVADVPVCTFLSGGLDSSAITAIASSAFREAGQEPLRSYSVDYVENERHFRPDHFQPNSDADWVAVVSRELGTSHRNILIDTPELVDALVPALRVNDLPGMADIDSSLYLFCREVKKEATVALSGESADEVFGGYPWFYSEEALRGNSFPWVRLLRERMGLLSPDLVDQIRPEEYVAQRFQEALEEVPRLTGEDEHEARVRQLFYLNITRFMPTLLDRKDRMSMGVGLEVRVPFCDHHLVEYVWNIPWSMKTCNGQEKGILRHALAGLLPVGVLARRKSPYPKTHHPAYLAAVRHWLLQILDDPESPLQRLINVEAVRNLARSGTTAMSLPWFGQLMNLPQLFAYLAQVDTWLREDKIIIK